MSTVARQDLLSSRLDRLDTIPAVPSVLRPLLDQLDAPIEELNMYKVLELLSREPTVAARCLQMANSPLYGRSRPVATLRAAVIALGIAQVRHVVISTCLVKLMSDKASSPNPEMVWSHAFGCAMVSRQFAKMLGWEDIERAHLAGLLHDFGFIVNIVLFPKQMREIMDLVEREHMPILDAELQVLGFTHEETGAEVGTRWNFPAEFVDVMSHHHSFEQAASAPALVGLVALSDILCRFRGMDYGIPEYAQLDLLSHPAWQVVGRTATSRQIDLERFTFEMDEYAAHVHTMVQSLLTL